MTAAYLFGIEDTRVNSLNRCNIFILTVLKTLHLPIYVTGFMYDYI